MIVLDASVLIAHLDGADKHHDRARGLLETSSGEVLGASVISLAETLVAPARTGRLADAEGALRHLGVKELTLGRDDSGHLAAMRAEVGLKMPDCCVLLAARQHSGRVASFDLDLLTAARKLGLEAVG